MDIDISSLFEGHSDKLKNLIGDILCQCNRHSIDIYLVGGYVRDYMLSVYSSDIDMVFVGDTSKILDYIDNNFKNYEHSESFKTIKISIDKFEIDLVTARKEIYKTPGALPSITPSNIIDDLSRRDFTINSMALKLNSPELTQVIDLNLSKKDLEDKIIRVHHSLSFIDDPTRIFRAFRYGARYSFDIEEKTKELIEEEIKNRKFRNISYIRILNEISKDFKEINYKSILEFYKNYDIYDIMFSDRFPIRYLLSIHDKFYNSKTYDRPYSGANLYKTSIKLFKEEELINLLLLTCIHLADKDKFDSFAENINKKIKKLARKIADILKVVYTLDSFEVYKNMDKLSIDERHILLYFVDDIIFSEILNTEILGKKTKPHVHISDILSKGIDKKYIGEILEDIHHYKFERGIISSNEKTLKELSPESSRSDKDDLNYLNIVIDRRKSYYLKKSGK
ncbi:MAG: hypothetical protein WBA54_06580 [Acidaminobacteraceae bacterium]